MPVGTPAQTWAQFFNPDALVLFVLLILILAAFAFYEWRSLLREWNKPDEPTKKEN